MANVVLQIMSSFQRSPRSNHDHFVAERFAIPDYSLIASVVAISTVMMEYLLTAFSTVHAQVSMLHALGLAMFLINVPTLIFDRFERWSITKNAGLLAFLGMMLLLVRQPVHPIFAHLFLLIGIAAFLIGFCFAIFVDRKRVLLTLIWALGYGFIIGPLVWGGGFRNPLSALSIANSGTTHTDEAFHNAVIAMLKTYGVCSTGMDGPIAYSYHHAAHLIASRLGFVLDAPPQVITTLIMPIILPAMLVCWSLRLLGSLHARITETPLTTNLRPIHHVIVLTGFGGFLPFHILEGTFICWNYSFSMDSQILGLLITSIALSLFLEILTVSRASDSSNPGCHRQKPLAYAMFVAVTSIALLTLSKITVAHLFTLGVLYIIWRAPGYSFLRRGLASAAAILVVVLCSIHSQIQVDSASLYFAPFGLWLDRVPLQAWPLCVPVNSFFASFYAIARLSQKSIVTLNELICAVKRRSIVDVEIVLLIAMSGSLLTTVFGGSWAFNAIYYQSTAQFFSICCAAAAVTWFLSPGSRWSILNVSVGRSAACLLLIFMFSTSVMNSFVKYQEILRANMQSRGQHFAIPLGVPSDGTKPEIRVLLRQGQVRKSMELLRANTQHTEEQLANGEKAIVQTMINLREEVPLSMKKDTLLWIPKSNRAFWDLAPKGRRWMLPMLAVGLTEVSLVDGFPEEVEPSGGGFGFAAYARKHVVEGDTQSLAEILRRSRILGFPYVIELQGKNQWLIHHTE